MIGKVISLYHGDITSVCHFSTLLRECPPLSLRDPADCLNGLGKFRPVGGYKEMSELRDGDDIPLLLEGKKWF
jgi:hypothetical protein